MAQAPNTTRRQGFLRSVGDGSNASVWSPPIGTWTKEVDSSTVLKDTKSVALGTPLDVTVFGYQNYLVIYNASIGSNDTGGPHSAYIRIALDSTLTGPYSRVTLDAKSGGTVYYRAFSTSYIISTDTGNHTISGYGFIENTSGSNATADVASLTVIGLP